MTFRSPVDGTQMLLTPEMSIQHQVSGLRTTTTTTTTTGAVANDADYGCCCCGCDGNDDDDRIV